MILTHDRLHDHVVGEDFGTSGGEAVAELLRRGTSPDDIVVIDSRQTVLETAEVLGVNYLCGDASHNAVLEAAAIRRARAVEISAGRDDQSILIVLSARKPSPAALIPVVIRSVEN